MVTRVVQIRSYNLKPGSGARFHELMSTRSMPLLRAAGTDVIAFGPSRHAAEGYYLIRAYDNIEHLQTSQDDFYSSAAWREGPREEILRLLETYIDAVVPLTPEAVEAIRHSHQLFGGDDTAARSPSKVAH